MNIIINSAFNNLSRFKPINNLLNKAANFYIGILNDSRELLFMPWLFMINIAKKNLVVKSIMDLGFSITFHYMKMLTPPFWPIISFFISKK